MTSLWYVGVIIYCSGAISMALGINLQKLSLNRNSAKPEKDQKAVIKQPLWLIGVILYTSSGIMLSTSLYFAAQALLSPLMSVVLLANAALGRFLLKEDFTRRHALATFVIIVAVVITTIFAPHQEVQYLASELLAFYSQPPFIVFCVVVGVSVSALFAINRWKVHELEWLATGTNHENHNNAGDNNNHGGAGDRKKSAAQSDTEEDTQSGIIRISTTSRKTSSIGSKSSLLLALSSPGINYDDTVIGMPLPTMHFQSSEQRHVSIGSETRPMALSQSLLQTADEEKGVDEANLARLSPFKGRRVSRLLPFSYAAIAGICGGFCSVMMKSAISVIVEEVQTRGVVAMLETWLVYILIVLLAGSWMGQMIWINMGVKHFPAVYIVAIEAIVNEITGIIGGLLYFQEYKLLDSLHMALFIVGVCTGVAGVAILATKKQDLR